MPITDDQFDTLSKEVRELTREVTRYTTVTHRHMAESEKTNRHLDRLIADHEHRIRTLEAWKAGSEPRLPDRVLDADKVEGDIEALQRDLHAIREKLARYGGAVVVIWAVAQVVIVPGVQALWKYMADN